MEQVWNVIPYLDNPLSLVGFGLLLLFGLYRVLIKSGILPPVSPEEGSIILRQFLKHGFVLIALLIVLGFGLEFYKQHNASQQNDQIAVTGDNAVVVPVNEGTINIGPPTAPVKQHQEDMTEDPE